MVGGWYVGEGFFPTYDLPPTATCRTLVRGEAE